MSSPNVVGQNGYRNAESSRTMRVFIGPGLLIVAALLFLSAKVHAGNTCVTPPPSAKVCTGACADPNHQCVPVEILGDADGNFLAITCCDCEANVPGCHVDVTLDTNDIICVKDCPNPPGFPCTLIEKGNMDGTFTYVCECRDPSDPAGCEPISECNPCLPGSCVERCPGPCPDPTDPCVPTVINEDPPFSGNYTLLGCDCDPECRPIVTSMGVECVDQCPDGATPCPEPEIVDNPQGQGIDYTCPPCPGAEVCPEPVGQDLCTDLPAPVCLSDDPSLNCLPTCVNFDADGNITALECDCRNLEDCHVVVTGPAEPYCEGVCPPGETCVRTVTDDGSGGQDICCECLPCGEDPWGPGCLPVECPDPTELCLPGCVNDDGVQITALDCECRNPEDCHVDTSGPEPTCIGDCPPGELCVRTETDDGAGGIDICCACERWCGPGDCCAGRPDLQGYPAGLFIERVAVGTAAPSILGGFVVTVFDMSKAVLDGAPFNQDFYIDRYSDPSWDQYTLGSVFGITLDPAGNIYVTASTSYSSNVQGICPGWGGVYRINGVTGVVTCFADLPNTGAGLGNISYDCEHDQFFVTNFDDGMIYRIDTSGNVLSTFDHGLPNNPSDFYAPLGDRPWGVEAHRGKVYYGVWSQDLGRNPGAGPNEIWSVPLDGSGEFDTGVALEITLPQISGAEPFSNPVSDIRFTPKAGRMLLAERTMFDDTTSIAHKSRLLEYACMGTLWLPSANTFEIGGPPGRNCAGGVDIDYKPGGRVWATGDMLQNVPWIYGLQGLPATGGPVTASILIDYNGFVAEQDKTEIGDVVVNCPACVDPPDQMVAWWPFDEVVGPIAVDIAGPNYGTHNPPLIGPTPLAAGKVAGALLFDGFDDYVEVSDHSSIRFNTDSFSIDAWVRPNSVSSMGPIVEKNDGGFFGYTFMLDAAGTPTLQLIDGLTGWQAQADYPIPAQTWTHLAVTLSRGSPSQVSFYIDGQPAGVTPLSGFGPIGNTDPLWIGKSYMGSFFGGMLDEIELFDRVLTELEIWEIFQAGSNGKCKECHPEPDLQSCESFDCPGQFDYCQLMAVKWDQTTGDYSVLRCRCGMPAIWHLELNLRDAPTCVGDCPPGATCTEEVVENTDGTIDISCEMWTAIPTVSEWGMVALAALMLAAGAVIFTRRRAAQLTTD